jgi:hypothetical protein
MTDANRKQDELMNVMQDSEKLELLYDLWQIVRHTPTRAAEILIEFKDTQASMRNMIADLQETLARFDVLRERLPDLKEVSQVLKDTTRDLAGTDEKALNRLSRIIEAADQVRKLKQSGALDLLKGLQS